MVTDHWSGNPKPINPSNLNPLLRKVESSQRLLSALRNTVILSSVLGLGCFQSLDVFSWPRFFSITQCVSQKITTRIPSRPLASQPGPAVRVQRDQRPGRSVHPGHHGHLEQERCHPPSLKSVLQYFELQSLNGKLISKVAAPKTWNTSKPC